MHRALFSLTVALLIAGCTTAPVTGRQQLVVQSQPQATEMGREAYQEILATKGVSSDPQLHEMVRRVGQRLVRASGQTGLDWQINIIKDETRNACAQPGGCVGGKK